MKHSYLNILTTLLLAFAMCVVLPSCQKKTFCQKSDAAASAACNIGDYIVFGHYEQDNNTSNGKDPIIWRILDKNDKGQYLILSDEVLDVKPYDTTKIVKPYNTTKIAVFWEKSTIRSWLNGYDASYNTAGNDYASDNFIDTAFTDEEKKQIVASTLSTDATTDKIFLLSKDEVKKYFSDDDDPSTDATEYAIKNGAALVTACEAGGACYWPKYRHHTIWWLRSMDGPIPGLADTITNYGHFNYNSLDMANYGVRPALWIQY